MQGIKACRNKIQNRLALEDGFVKAFNTMKTMLGDKMSPVIKSKELVDIESKIEELLAKEKIFIQMEVKGLMTDELQIEYDKLVAKVLKLQNRKKEILRYNADAIEQSDCLDKYSQYFQELGEMKEFNEEICRIMLQEIIVMSKNRLLYKFRNGYTADVEVIDYYLYRDEIGEVKIYASTEC